MYQNCYFVDKSTGTFADSLVAYGLAKLLSTILYYAERYGDFFDSQSVFIRDKGSHYEVTLDDKVELNEAMIEVCEHFTLEAKYIKTGKNKDKIAAFVREASLLDYEVYKERDKEYRALSIEISRLKLQSDDPQISVRDSKNPGRNWELYQTINQMAAIISFNELITQWEQAEDYYKEILKLILYMFSSYPNKVEEASQKWKKMNFDKISESTASQVFNPISGKGNNGVKTNILSMRNMSNFWLLEFLKVVGAFECATPRLIRQGQAPYKDRKMYVLAPRDLKYSASNSIIEAFQNSFDFSSSVAMDLSASLTYTKLFLENAKLLEESGDIQQGNYKPSAYVLGFHTVYYKSLGNGSAVMNLAFIGLPNWIEKVESREQIEQYRKIIDEHQKALRNIDEGRSEEFELLLTYRNFLSAGDLDALLDFYALYGNLYMRIVEREWERRGRYFVLLITQNLEVIIMGTQNPNLRKIVYNQGFKKIAYALRQSTVMLQRDKALGKRMLYEPKYGLIQDLKRKGQYKDQFILALSEFISNYNLETEQVYEKQKGFKKNEEDNSQEPRDYERTSVEPTHLDSLAELIEELEEIDKVKNASEIVCNLLAAYGSAAEYVSSKKV